MRTRASSPLAVPGQASHNLNGIGQTDGVEARNIGIEARLAGGKLERLHEFAAEFVRIKVDLPTPYLRASLVRDLTRGDRIA
jgi:hypothetical protein